MQLSIGGVPAVTINKVIKDLTLTIHYMDKYLRKIWGLPNPASNSPTNHTDITGDLEDNHMIEISLKLSQIYTFSQLMYTLMLNNPCQK